MKRSSIILGVLTVFIFALQGGFCNHVNGYSLSQIRNTSYGLSGELNIVGEPPHLYDTDIKTLHLDVYFETEARLRVKIFDPENSRWEVPFVVANTTDRRRKKNEENYVFSYTDSPFGFAVARRYTGNVLFNTSATVGKEFNPLVFEDHYIEFSTQYETSPYIYGLGERVDSFLLAANEQYNMFAKDCHGAIEKDNLYGHHPFYLQIQESGQSHGVFLLNSNAMGVEITQEYLTWRTVGGIVDLYIFTGPTPSQVVAQYTELIGRPHMPPMWGLGWHQCKWGYENISVLEEVAVQYSKNNLPLDVLWSDLDYMEFFRDFTIDQTRYPEGEFGSFVAKLNMNGQHYIPIIDPALHIKKGYKPYDTGIEMDIFVKNPENDNYLEGMVWPGLVNFPDWFHPNTSKFWEDLIGEFYNRVQLSGLWTDMNEPSNFCQGRCDVPVGKIDSIDLNDPPYNPLPEKLDESTMDMSARHYGGLLHYNTHSLYGYMEAKITAESLLKIRDNRRPFVISRSTYPSAGTFTGHWLGDNKSNWDDLYYSVPGIFAFNMFGIPLVGVDICGFMGETTRELCARWMAIGTLYPFSRNHNEIGRTDQSPFAFDDEFTEWSRVWIRRKYSLINYYYTLFFKAHQYGDTVFKPLLFEFPQDKNTWTIDKQAMVGPALLISPVLTERAVTVDAYLPTDCWYDYVTGERVVDVGNVTLNSPLGTIPIHIRGGHIIPHQTPALTVQQTRDNPYYLVGGLGCDGNSRGDLFIDDGETEGTIENGDYSLISFNINKSQNNFTLSSTLTVHNYDLFDTNMNRIVIFGIESVERVFVDGRSWPYYSLSSGGVFEVLNLNLCFDAEFSIEWS